MRRRAQLEGDLLARKGQAIPIRDVAGAEIDPSQPLPAPGRLNSSGRHGRVPGRLAARRPSSNSRSGRRVALTLRLFLEFLPTGFGNRLKAFFVVGKFSHQRPPLVL